MTGTLLRGEAAAPQAREIAWLAAQANFAQRS
jgi:hypothetical protein